MRHGHFLCPLHGEISVYKIMFCTSNILYILTINWVVTIVTTVQIMFSRTETLLCAVCSWKLCLKYWAVCFSVFAVCHCVLYLFAVVITPYVCLWQLYGVPEWPQYLCAVPQPQTYGIQSAGVCVPCNCNSFGSKSFDCDESGQCRCQPGVTGPKCDRCAPGHFNFQEGGCTRNKWLPSYWLMSMNNFPVRIVSE